MNLNEKAYHISKLPPSYCQITGQAQQRDIRNQRLEIFKKNLINKRIRKPKELIQKINKTIHLHIYEMTLQELIEQLKYQNPQYDQDLIDVETRQLYDLIISSDNLIMIKQQPTILQYDPETIEIKNKRKIKYQNFLKTYQTQTNIEFIDKQRQINEKVSHDDILALEFQLNQMLKEQLLNENIKFKKIDIFLEDSEMDPMNQDELKDMKKLIQQQKILNKQKQLTTFRQEHIASKSDYFNHTDKSDFQVLQNILTTLLGKDVSFSQRTTIRPIKIQKTNMQNLLNFQGKLKKNIINKVITQISKKHNL